MNPRPVFGLGILLGLASSDPGAVLLVAYTADARQPRSLVVSGVTAQMFLRFIGLSFLVPGVVAASVSKQRLSPYRSNSEPVPELGPLGSVPGARDLRRSQSHISVAE